MTLKEWIIDIFGCILMITALILIILKQIDIKTFLILLGSGFVMVIWTVKKLGSILITTLNKFIKKKFG